MSNRVTVHVIDDDAAMRDSLQFLMSAHGLSVRTYPSALEFLDAGAPHEPGCVVTDVRMPLMSGLELLKRITADGIDLPVIVITGHGDVPLAVEAMKRGAVDFIEKPFDDAALIDAVSAAIRSHTGHAAPEPVDAERAEIALRLELLSPREHDVLDGLVDGKPNKIIARDLGISPRTVEVYRANLMSKLQARALADLIRMALLAGK